MTFRVHSYKLKYLEIFPVARPTSTEEPKFTPETPLKLQKRLTACKPPDGTVPMTFLRPKLCPGFFLEHWLRPTHVEEQLKDLTI